jgi:hypothetical protein
MIAIIEGYALVFLVNMQTFKERKDLILILGEVVILDLSIRIGHVLDNCRKLTLYGLRLISQLVKPSLVIVMGSEDGNDLRKTEEKD